MNTYVRAAAITGGIAVPAAVAYNAHMMNSENDWDGLVAVIADIYGGGGLTALSFAVAGVTALVPAWRKAAPIAAGIGTGFAAATGAGLLTVKAMN